MFTNWEYTIKFLLVDKFFNYSAIVNFSTGKVKMVLQVKNKEDIIYEVTYKSDVDRIIEDFVTVEEDNKIMLLPLGEDYISD